MAHWADSYPHTRDETTPEVDTPSVSHILREAIRRINAVDHALDYLNASREYEDILSEYDIPDPDHIDLTIYEERSIPF